MTNAEMVKGVFCDAYLFYQKYEKRPNAPGMWEEATKDFSEVLKKYNGNVFCCRHMLSTFMQLEKEKGINYGS